MNKKLKKILQIIKDEGGCTAACCEACMLGKYYYFLYKWKCKPMVDYGERDIHFDYGKFFEYRLKQAEKKLMEYYLGKIDEE